MQKIFKYFIISFLILFGLHLVSVVSLNMYTNRKISNLYINDSQCINQKWRTYIPHNKTIPEMGFLINKKNNGKYQIRQVMIFNLPGGSIIEFSC